MLRPLFSLATFAIAMVYSAAQPLVAGALKTAPAPRLSASATDGVKPGAFATAGDDGLFRVSGHRAGNRITMIVDTGATTTVLSAGDARALGIPLDGGLEADMRTANGNTTIRYARVSGLHVGGHHLAPIDVAVARSGLDHSLVGLDVIGRLGRITIDQGRMDVTPGNRAS